MNDFLLVATIAIGVKSSVMYRNESFSKLKNYFSYFIETYFTENEILLRTDTLGEKIRLVLFAEFSFRNPKHTKRNARVPPFGNWGPPLGKPSPPSDRLDRKSVV